MKKIGVVLSYLLVIVDVLSAFFLTPIIIKCLGDAEYGVYKLSSSINSYLLMLDMGIGASVIRFISSYRVSNDIDGCRKFLGVSNVFYLIISFICLILGVLLVNLYPIIFSNGLSSEETRLGQQLLAIMIVNSAFTLAFSAFSNALIAFEKFSISRGSSIVQIIIRFVLSVVLLKMGFRSISIVLLSTLLNIACKAFFAVYVIIILKVKPTFKGVDARLIKEVFSFSSLVSLQIIATQLNNSIDQILIGALVSSASVVLSVYSVGMLISSYFQTIGSSFYSVLMPSTTRFVENYYGNPDKMTDEMTRISRLAFFVLGLVWVAFLCLGKEFIFLWVGRTKKEAYYIAVILMSGSLFSMTELVGSQMLWALNMHKEQSIFKLIIVLLNSVFTFFLIKWNPTLGAALGTFSSLLIGDVILMNVIYAKKLAINLSKFYMGLFKGTYICITATGIVGFVLEFFLPSGWGFFLLKGIIVLLVYAVGLWFVGFNESEKAIVSAIFDKVLILMKRSRH